MRKVTFGVACSLDHYIARKDHSIDWLLFDKEAASAIREFWKTIDTVLMGRGTYDAAPNSGGSMGVKTYVLSRTLKESADPHVEIISKDAAGFVRDLKSQDGKGIFMMGGGRLAQPLLEAGVIDEVELNIHPVLLGSGIPLFLDMSKETGLELIDCKPFKNGCVYVTYRVKH